MSGIAHIGIAVENLPKAIESYTDILGYPPAEIEDIPDQKVKVAMFVDNKNSANGRIELLSPTDISSPIKKFLDRYGEGLHHIALKVDNIETKLKELKDKGYRLIDEKPRIGVGGKKIAFLHPASVGGVLLELQE